jgi:putative acetyltransferase
MIEIRRESPGDLDAIRTVNNLAFEQLTEGRIVDKIRGACDDTLSLVATNNGDVIGHIFFSPALIRCNGKVIEGMGLAPMAVLPDFQNQGIGSLLVKEGIRILTDAGCPFIIVLGHPNYYPRFGFEIASKYSLSPQWEGIPNEAFMILITDKDIEGDIHGVAYYRDEFNEAV